LLPQAILLLLLPKAITAAAGRPYTALHLSWMLAERAFWQFASS
jgi:hypothetical protein